MPHLRLLLNPLLWLLLAASAAAQNRPAAPRQAAPAPNCLVSEFRGMALGTHDVAERAKQAADWMRRNGSDCSEEQLRLLSSNRTAWLGTADSPRLMGLFDGALEAKLKNRPELLAQMFAAVPPRVAGNETMRAGDLAPRPAPVVGPGTPAVVGGGAVAVSVQVNNAAPPAPTTPLGLGSYFTEQRKALVQKYFTENRGEGPCPPDLILKGNKCESPISQRPWKLGESLPSLVTPKPIPMALLERLGAPPANHSVVMAAGDLLLIENDSKKVVDYTTDLGGIAPKPQESSPSTPTSATPTRPTGPVTPAKR